MWFNSVVQPRKKRRNKLGENCKLCPPGSACCFVEQREGVPFGQQGHQRGDWERRRVNRAQIEEVRLRLHTGWGCLMDDFRGC